MSGRGSDPTDPLAAVLLSCCRQVPCEEGHPGMLARTNRLRQGALGRPKVAALPEATVERDAFRRQDRAGATPALTRVNPLLEATASRTVACAELP